MVKRSVRVKVVVTERFRACRAAEIRSALSKLEAVKKRIDFELEASTKRGSAGAVDVRLGERLKAGQRNNERARAALLSELETLSALEIGSEYDRGTLEGIVEVEVGDDFSRLASCEIVVKDDKIVEIRDGSCPEISRTS